LVMARAPAINQGVVLPQPQEKYDVSNERETRRLLEEALRRLLDYNTITSVPPNVTSLAGLDGTGGNGVPYFSGADTLTLATLTAFGRALIAAVDAAAGRTALGIGALLARTNVVLTTASLANLAAESGSKNIGTKAGSLLVIAADRACRVRLYGTSADRVADDSRTATTKPTAGLGLLAEFVFAAAGTIHVSPIATIANDDGPTADVIWYAVQNLSGGTSTVQITLTVLPLELP
ncbi:MAG: hypothetical protein ACREPM_21790, partial [Gemmatimonadaceae bacterium]